MAMKKAEMEAHRQEYHALMAKARSAEWEGLYRTAVESALSSWDHIDGMMQYERRYEEKEFTNIEGIDMILKYAPLLLDFASLDRLETILKETRRIEKNTSESMADKVAEARTLMWDAHRLWDHVEQNPEARQDRLSRVLGGKQEQWRSIAAVWGKMGLLQRTSEGGSYRLALSTRMGQVVLGKCPGCGGTVNAPKAMLLEKVACPECGASVLFVMLSAESSIDTKD